MRRSFEFVAVASPDARLLFMNPAGRALIGLAGESEELPGEIVDLFAADDLAFVREVILSEFGATGRWSGDFRFQDVATGGTVPVHLSLFAIAGAGAERDGIAIVARDNTGRRRADARLRLLVDAGAVLAQSLDYVATFENLGELIVRSGLASYCTVDVFTAPSDGRTGIERVCAVHADASRLPHLQRLARFSPYFEGRAHPIGYVLEDGSSSLVAQVDAAWLERATVDAEHAEGLRELGPRSLITVPLVAAGDIVGALSCVLGEESAPRESEGRHYDAEDLFFIEELGRRAGAALRNAQTYERERRIAVSLQAASLPQALPAVAGAFIAAEYRPGSAEATIGGDWYDAFVLDDGRLALTVGDVLGHGLGAAITMTKLRQAMQSAALVKPDPRTMLDAAQRMLRVHAPDGYATALGAILDIEAGTLCYASAGHPPPLVCHRDGALREGSSGGVMLGAGPSGAFELHELATLTGSLLCFFTDGLIEATRDLEEGYERVRAALRRIEFGCGASAARSVVEAVLRGADARDDIAVVTVEIFGPGQRANA